MRIAFLGTPDAAVPSLRALVRTGHEIVIVITRPDRRRGRGPELSPSPVKAAATEMGIPVAHRLRDIDPSSVDLGVVVAYGAMIPVALLEQVPMLNVHFSLLPRWRGAAPVERAILAGDPVTGVSVMSLEPELDTGPVHLQRQVEVGDKTAEELMTELAMLGANALVEVLASPELLEHPRPQVGEVTYAEKLNKETYRLRPSMTRAESLRTAQLGRAFAMVEGRRIRIDHVEDAGQADVDPGAVAWIDGRVLLGCADGPVAVTELQPEGARPMSAAAWWAGARLDSMCARWS
ncbi:MAG TPA: methionyl-tRNA formyltransferase [Acidimicrobiales bacterium]|nr:methionyl-tRNA formyltransferase [Acidimicrobiales bacterium]